MSKKILSALIFGTLCLTCTSGAFAEEVLPKEAATTSQPAQMQLSGMDIAKGSITGSAFETTKSLTSKNGKIVNFWIQNNGTTSVAITINGKEKRTIEPGAQGHISTDVGYISKDYKCKAVPVPNGGDIDIDYKIAQRDKRT